jgi:hypothetical protein
VEQRSRIGDLKARRGQIDNLRWVLGDAVRIDVVVVELGHGPEVGTGLPKQAEAETFIEIAVRRLAVRRRPGAGRRVEAVAGLDIGCGAHRQRVADRDVHKPTAQPVVVVAVLDLGVARIAAEMRIVGDDEDRARVGVLAGERALRPAQHLDAGDIVIGRALEKAGEGGDAVPICDHPGRGLDVGQVLADAADVEQHRAAIVGDGERRRVELQVIEVVDADVLQLGAVDHGDGQGCGLQVDGPPFGGDRHHRPAALIGRRGGGRRRVRRLGGRAGLRRRRVGQGQDAHRQGQAGNRGAQRRGAEASVHLVVPLWIERLARRRRALSPSNRIDFIDYTKPLTAPSEHRTIVSRIERE